MQWIKNLFTDTNGKPSSKRVIGTILVAGAVVLNAIGLGDPETNRVMIWAGIAAVGVGTLETKVSK